MVEKTQTRILVLEAIETKTAVTLSRAGALDERLRDVLKGHPKAARVTLFAPNETSFGEVRTILATMAAAARDARRIPVALAPSLVPASEEKGGSGRLESAIIQREVRSQFPVFQGCYQMGRSRDPGLEGRVELSFVIGRRGEVASLSTKGSLSDAAVIQCIEKHFRTLRFPFPQGGIIAVRYPIVFSPRSEPR